MLTVKQVAERLNVSEKTVYSWAFSGYLPGHKLGDLWRFEEGEFEEWLASRKHKPTDCEALTKQIVASCHNKLDIERIVN